MSYMFTPTMMLDTLEQRIRQLHEAVGNVKNVSSYHVLPCYGATGCGQAVINALASVLGERETRQYTLAGQRPLYFDYPNWAPAANGGAAWALVWNQSAIEDPSRLGQDGDVVELLNTPANPDGAHRTPAVTNTSKLIVDAVFNWPYQNRVPVVELDFPIQLYSMSKNTGHAGTRFGWALIQDDDVYQEALNHVGVTTLGISIDGQARAATILQAVLDTLEDEPERAARDLTAPSCARSSQGSFYNQSKLILAGRWAQVEAAAEQCPTSRSMRLVNTASGGANLWLKFEPNGTDAEGVLSGQAGLRAIGGAQFLVDPSFARINMLVSDSTFSLLRQRIKAFCASGLGTPGKPVPWGQPGQLVMAP
jgi:hypothetical protein